MESSVQMDEPAKIYSNPFCTNLMGHKTYWELCLEFSLNDSYKIIFRYATGNSFEYLPATFTVEFFILNKEQKKEKLDDVTKLYFKKVRDYYSYPIDLKYLTDGKYLFDDTLTIICNLVVYDIPRTSPLPSFDTFLESLSKDINNLLISEQNSDVILIVNETEFIVHKAILSARSPVFAVMFSHQVVIKDTNSEAMKKFLEFIYSDKIEKLDDEKFDVWILADKYQIELLKIYCEKFISFHVNEQCVLEVLKFAGLHDIENLLNYTLNNFLKQTIENVEWKSLAVSDPRLFDLILNRLVKGYNKLNSDGKHVFNVNDFV